MKTSYTQQTPITVMPCSLHSIATATRMIDSTIFDHTAINTQPSTAVDRNKINFHFKEFLIAVSLTFAH